VTPWGACAGAGFWQDLWPHGERSPRRSRFAGRACDPTGDPRWSSLFLNNCTPWEGPQAAEFCGEMSHVGRTPRWSQGRVRGGRSSRDNV